MGHASEEVRGGDVIKKFLRDHGGKLPGDPPEAYSEECAGEEVKEKVAKGQEVVKRDPVHHQSKGDDPEGDPFSASGGEDWDFWGEDLEAQNAAEAAAEAAYFAKLEADEQEGAAAATGGAVSSSATPGEEGGQEKVNKKRPTGGDEAKTPGSGRKKKHKKQKRGGE